MNGMFPRQVWRERHPCVPRVNTIIPTFPFIRSTPAERSDLEKCLWRRHADCAPACSRARIRARVRVRALPRSPSLPIISFFLARVLANPPRGYLKDDSDLDRAAALASLDPFVAPAAAPAASGGPDRVAAASSKLCPLFSSDNERLVN